MLLIVDHIMVLVREQHSREDFDIMSVLRPVIPLLAGTCLSSASYNTRELINGLYFWFPQRKGKVRSLYRLMPGLTEFQKASNNCQRLYHESLSGAAVGFLAVSQLDPRTDYERER